MKRMKIAVVAIALAAISAFAIAGATYARTITSHAGFYTETPSGYQSAYGYPMGSGHGCRGCSGSYGYGSYGFSQSGYNGQYGMSMGMHGGMRGSFHP